MERESGARVGARDREKMSKRDRYGANERLRETRERDGDRDRDGERER